MKNLVATLGVFFLSACQPSLDRQPRRGMLSSSSAFENGMAARPLPAGTVPFRGNRAITLLRRPTLAQLESGQARYNIHCTACHGPDGERGIVRERGFPEIPSLLAPHALQLTDPALSEIIRHGIGRMAPMGNRLTFPEIAGIVAYLRALQFSQRARAESLPPEDQLRLAGAAR